MGDDWELGAAVADTPAISSFVAVSKANDEITGTNDEIGETINWFERGIAMPTCIFCDIINRKAEGHIIYEDDLVCCFLDKYPINPGHVLVVPKRHAVEFTDVDPASLQAVILAGQKAAKAIESSFGTDGITVMQNNGIFKDVEHYHMHIVPRYKRDGFGWVEPEIDVSSIDFDSLEKKIRGAMEE